jgi:hypothetical protein
MIRLGVILVEKDVRGEVKMMMVGRLMVFPKKILMIVRSTVKLN